MFYQLRKQIRTRRFEWATRGIRATPPVRVVAAPWTFVSMVGDDDVQLYLLAMKTFYRRLGRGNIVAIVANTMSQARRDLLTEHFDGIRIEALEAIDTGRCQRGGTWERLVYILDRARDGYVVQIDCDTLAIGDELDEVA